MSATDGYFYAFNLTVLLKSLTRYSYMVLERSPCVRP